MPLICSSARLANSFIGGMFFNICLPPSRKLANKLPDSILAKWLFNAPTFSEIDMSLSLRITSMSLCISPAWFNASKAIPAVMAPSPITETTFLFLPSFSAATAKPSAAEIEVLE